MQEVLALTQARLDAFQRRPLYAFMADRSIAPETRLSFGPHLAHFIMSFADLCMLVLREEPAADRFQEIVNAHAVEDNDHWRWYLNDLEQLGRDRQIRFSDALRFLWGQKTEKSRMLTYRLCRLALGASSLQKLIVVTVLEATAKVGLERTARVAREFVELSGRELVYFGAHHVQTENQHTLLTEDVQSALGSVSLDAETRQALCRVVDQAFDAFTELVDELFRATSCP